MDLVTVKSFSNRIEANIAKGFLEQNGILAAIAGDDQGGVHFPFKPFGIKLLVRETELNEAHELLGD